MTQAYCERRDFPVPKRWLYAGSDLSRPDHGGQYAARPAAGTAREKRALTRWKRLPTPPAGLVSALSILFAAEFLSQKSNPVDSDPILIDLPKAGEAIVIDLVFGRMPDSRLGLQPNRKELGHIFLSTGEEFFVIAGLVKDFDANKFCHQHQPFSRNMDSTFLQQPVYADPDNLREQSYFPLLATVCLGLWKLDMPTSTQQSPD
jgi:hypothetical protein